MDRDFSFNPVTVSLDVYLRPNQTLVLIRLGEEEGRFLHLLAVEHIET
jgi:hypothetical protein